MDTAGTLTILPPFGAVHLKGEGPSGADGFLMTAKFVRGVLEYQRLWGGPVQVLVEEAERADDNLDNVRWAAADLPFAVRFVRYDSPEMGQHLAGSALVLLAMHHRQLGFAEICRGMNIPAVFITEISLKTRLQIIAAEAPNPLSRARRSFWAWRQDGKAANAIRVAAGVQCNGTPTYETYRSISRDPLLYFDTRVTAQMLPTPEAVRARAARPAGQPLRLAFSGRLVAIKGVDDLVRCAAALQRRGVNFTLSIFGGGGLEEGMKRDVAAAGLNDRVRFHGVADFERELVPAMRRQVDLFVCCHRQGDPSCTYLETMACGVPIVGYANEAFAGLNRVSGCGWVTPMNRPEALAAKIAELAKAPDELLSHSLKSLDFASGHTVETTFARRVEHLQRVAGRPAEVLAGTSRAGRLSAAESP
jgi:glycosyltransferase involved in cell wall biosynthesis